MMLININRDTKKLLFALLLIFCESIAITSPEISIIVPIYNTPEKFLKECLDSLINQTFQNIEIICIDDGSTERRPMEVLREYRRNDPRIRIFVHSKNAGMAAARNTGLDAAIGKYFAFADSDDYMHPDTLKILHTEIEKGDFDIVTCDINRPKENAAPNFFKIDDYKIKEVGIEEIISFASVWGKLFRKSCFEGIKFSTDLFGCDDTFFMLCIHSLVKKSANVYMKLYYWRKNSNSAGSNPFSRKITISMERMLKKYLIMPIDNKVCLMALGYMFTYWVASLQHDVFVKWETFFLLLKMMNKAYSRGVLSTVNQCDTIQKRCCSHGGMDAIKEYFLYTCLQIHLITAFLGNKLRSIAKRFFCLSKNMC